MPPIFAIGVRRRQKRTRKATATPEFCIILGTDIVTVHLAFAKDDFHCLLDGELFLSESWSEDRDRCDAAGIPQGMVHRPKWQIALEQYDRAEVHGVDFGWLTFDEGYGAKTPFFGLWTHASSVRQFRNSVITKVCHFGVGLARIIRRVRGARNSQRWCVPQVGPLRDTMYR